MTVKEMAKMGARARNNSLSAAQRKELARHAAETRWTKYRTEKIEVGHESQTGITRI
jgi:hypothetical protein